MRVTDLQPRHAVSHSPPEFLPLPYNDIFEGVVVIHEHPFAILRERVDTGRGQWRDVLKLVAFPPAPPPAEVERLPHSHHDDGQDAL